MSMVTHLTISKEQFKSRAHFDLPENFRLIEVKPDFNLFLEQTRLIEPDWPLRKEYQECASIARSNIEGLKARMWMFELDGQYVGFCGLVADNLNDAFNACADFQGRRVAEIHKIGFYKGLTGQKLGHRFVPELMRKIFDELGYTDIYLNTRSSNRINSVPFYISLGFQVIKTEDLSAFRPSELHVA